MRSFEHGALVGTPEQIVERLVDLEARGMTYAITYFVEQAYDLSGVELFERRSSPPWSTANSTATSGTSSTAGRPECRCRCRWAGWGARGDRGEPDDWDAAGGDPSLSSTSRLPDFVCGDAVDAPSERRVAAI